MTFRKYYFSILGACIVIAAAVALSPLGVNPAACAEKQEEVETPFSKGARVTFQPKTEVPRRVVGINVFPSELKEGTVSLTKENAERVFKGFLSENKAFFRVSPEDLSLTYAKKSKDTWYVKFQQNYKGIPVYRATVGFTATEKGLVRTYGSSYYGDLDVPTEPKISLEEAVRIGKDTYDPAPGKNSPTRTARR